MTSSKYLSRQQLKLIFLSSLGGMFEYYDFIIYGFFAQILGIIFFPSSSPLLHSIEGFSVLAVGYLMRPLGGFVFGHFSDTRSRKMMFTVTLFIMAAATILTGFLPTYKQVGVWAPLMLILMRMIQGLALGGELPSAIALVAEHVPKENRGLACGTLHVGAIAGIFCASVFSSFIFKSFSQETIIEWAWRIPFVLGGILAIIGNFLRNKISESPVFIKIKQMQRTEKIPLALLLKNHKTVLIKGILLCGFASTVSSLSFYMPNYMHVNFNFPMQNILFINNISITVQCVTLVVMAYIGDKIGRPKLWAISSFIFLFSSYPLFLLLGKNDVTLVWCVFIFLGFISGMLISVLSAILAEIFPTNVRTNGIASSLNLGTAIFAAQAPIIFNLLIKETNSFYSPAYFICALAAFGIIAINKLPDKRLSVL